MQDNLRLAEHMDAITIQAFRAWSLVISTTAVGRGEGVLHVGGAGAPAVFQLAETTQHDAQRLLAAAGHLVLVDAEDAAHDVELAVLCVSGVCNICRGREIE